MDGRLRAVELVRRGSAREAALARLSAIAAAFATLAAGTAIAAWALGEGRWISLPPFTPAAVLGVMAALAVAVAVRAWPSASAAAGAAAFARGMESERALRRGSVSGLLELRQSDALAARADARLAQLLPDTPAKLAPKREADLRRRLRAVLAVLFVALAGLGWTGARHPDGLHALAHPLAALRGALLPPLELLAVPPAVERGSLLTIEVRAPDRRAVSVHSRAAGSAWQVMTVPVTGGIARAPVGTISAVTMVFASDARGASDTAVVRPTDPPFAAAEPPETRQLARNDEPPRVEIVVPAADTTVPGDVPVRIEVRASDDHGLAGVALHVRRGGVESVMPLGITRAGGSAAVLLDVGALAAGERLVIEAVAVEAAPARQRGRSGERTIAVLSSAEQRRAARAAADSMSAGAAALAAAQRESQRRTAELARARGERRTDGGRDNTAGQAGHALASRARAAVEEQRTLAARADSLAAATRSLEARLARAAALDDGLAARLAEVRSLLQRALSPELAARLRDAERAARDNAEDPLRQSLSDVALHQRRAREQLERVVQMLRRAAIEGALETLRAEAEELAAAAGDASGLSGRTRQLERDIASAVRQLREEQARAGVPPAERARLHAAAAGGQSAGTELAAGAAALAEARAAQIEEWKSELAADLDAAVQELVQLADIQAGLARRLAAAASGWRDEQSTLAEAAAAVARRVEGAARTSSLVSPRSDGLVRAARDRVARVGAPAIPPRDFTQTAALMREASAELSRAAASLVRDRERTNAARSASGFTELLEELQRLAAEQRGLNAAAAGIASLLGGAGGAGAREQARVLAQQQRAVARTLEEIGDADGGARAQPLAAEAHRIADALERAAVDGSVLARQERLYHRLLEGGRLLTGETEDEGRREAVAARAAEFPFARELSVIPADDRRHRAPGWAELRGLTATERQMVIEYFERLNARR